MDTKNQIKFDDCLAFSELFLSVKLHMGPVFWRYVTDYWNIEIKPEKYKNYRAIRYQTENSYNQNIE